MRLAAAVAGGLALVWLARRKQKRAPLQLDSTLITEPLPPASAGAMYEHGLELRALLGEFVRESPTPGFFYTVRPGDTLPSVAGEALGTIGPHGEHARLTYGFCIQSGPRFNLPTYGTPSTSNDFPDDLLVPGKRIGVRVAFRPRNEDAIAAMLSGRMPRMTVDPVTGAPDKTGSSLGTLWLPPVDPASLAIGEPSCGAYSWSDGSSSIDPPPELLRLLKAAA